MTGREKVQGERRPNRLISEKSPYLLQHAFNPVDWYPWGPEAFDRAAAEDRPVFLSVGYSTCHWCHVMEEESFEDPEVAGLMNETFVSVKVDREERPDLDSIYMTVCQMMTGGGGWPLTVLLTPEKKPFFSGTYFPKTSRFGRIGMTDLIPKVRKMWETERSSVLTFADEITAHLAQTARGTEGESLGEGIPDAAFDQLAARFDGSRGGFGPAPKFPMGHTLLFLLRYWNISGNERALEMVEKTLLAMRYGGIWDHLGFGFHRYSTDDRWLLPHFEKMLYDQALLIMAYTEAYQATGKEVFRETASQVITYVLRDMTGQEGAFLSAEDADSEGEEGRFYLWTVDEVARLLGKDADLVIRLFNLEQEGNFRDQATGEKTGANILHLAKSIEESAREFGMSESILGERLEKAMERLFKERSGRIRPHRDDKVLTDWNGLMIAALAKAAAAFDEPGYSRAAARAAAFILERMQTGDGRLLHRHREGESAMPDNLDDYAFFIWGLLELYEAVFDPEYLGQALRLSRILLDRFWDRAGGGFFFTPDDGEDLLTRTKEGHDSAVPSGNGVAAVNLLRLARITGDAAFEERGAGILRAFAGILNQAPSACTQLLTAFLFARGPSYEVVIAGNPQSEDTVRMLRSLREKYIPNKVLLLRPTDQESPGIVEIAGYTRHQTALSGRATAYVCRGQECRTPVTDVESLLALLRQVE